MTTNIKPRAIKSATIVGRHSASAAILSLQCARFTNKQFVLMAAVLGPGREIMATCECFCLNLIVRNKLQDRESDQF